MEFFLSFTLGAVSSWAISHFYYTRSLKDMQDGLIASRLDNCIDGDKAFLIAIAASSAPVPRYGTFTVEHIKKDGTSQKWASGTKVMVRSVESRVGHCIVTHYDDRQSDCQATLSLSDRGKECVNYLLSHEFREARFVEFDSSELTALAQFVAEHNREPKTVTTVVP